MDQALVKEEGSYIFLIFLFITMTVLNAQSNFLQADPMLERGITIFERMDSYKSEHYAFQNKEILKPSKAMLYSFLVPGLGQYLSGDDVKGFIYIGLEATAWYMNVHFNNLGDEGNRKVKAYADDPVNGFNRVEYYRGIYEAVNGVGTAPAIFSSTGSEEETFNSIKNDASLYADLINWEKNTVGDGVHTLPATKTQQYYEQVGKYKMFYHGWLALSDIDAAQSKFLDDIPDYIQKYYDKRNAMNAAYVKGTWAITAVMLNHVISAIEAFISTRIKLRSDYRTISYRNEKIPSLELTYQF